MAKGFPGRLKKKKTRKQLARELKEATYLDDAEPLTDELVSELAQKGWSEADLKRYQEMECIYLRSENTMFQPVK